jgi:hypothetical protein
MIKPPPMTPDLAELIRQAGKNRNYIMLAVRKSTLLVMFEGDSAPSVIKIEPPEKGSDPAYRVGGGD